MQHDLQKVIIRAAVPSLVGIVLVYGSRIGLHLTSDMVTPYVTGLVIATYSAAAHLAERRWPAAGRFLLGARHSVSPAQAVDSAGNPSVQLGTDTGEKKESGA